MPYRVCGHRVPLPPSLRPEKCRLPGTRATQNLFPLGRSRIVRGLRSTKFERDCPRNGRVCGCAQRGPTVLLQPVIPAGGPPSRQTDSDEAHWSRSPAAQAPAIGDHCSVFVGIGLRTWLQPVEQPHETFLKSLAKTLEAHRVMNSQYEASRFLKGFSLSQLLHVFSTCVRSQVVR